MTQKVLSAKVRPLEFPDAKFSSEIAYLTGLKGTWPNFTRPYMHDYPEDMRKGYMRSQLLASFDPLHQIVHVLELEVEDSESGRREKKIAGFAHWHLPSPEPESSSSAAGRESTSNSGVVTKTKDLKKEFARIAIKAWLPSTDRTSDTYRDNLLDEAAFTLIKEYKIQRNYLELYHIAIHPDFQRRGYGRLLLESGFQIANEIGRKGGREEVPVALLAVPEAVDMYKATGFREIIRREVVDDREDINFPGSKKVEVIFMIRDEQ